MGKHLNRASRSMQLRFLEGSFFDHFCVDFSVCFLVTFLMIFGAISGVIFYDVSVLFSIKTVNDFSIDLSSILGGFCGSKSLKMSTSCWRDAYFHKIAFSVSGVILGPKMI